MAVGSIMPASCASFSQRASCAIGSASSADSSSGGWRVYCGDIVPSYRKAPMSQFRALRVHQDGKAAVARLESITLADLSAGEVVIRVQWSGINYKDALAVTGKGRIMRKFPCVAGIDLAGTVESSD